MTIVNNSTSAFYDRSTQGLSALRQRAESLQQQLGRGERLSRSSDDPVAASRLRSLVRSDRLATFDTANANRAVADLTLSDAALTSLADTVMRVQELATQAANGTLNASQRAAIGSEIAQIHGNIVALANSRDSSGHALFGGETAGQAYSLDGAGNAVYGGTASAGELPLGEGTSVTRGLIGPEFLNFNTTGGPTDLMAVVKLLGEALQGAAADPAQAARDALDALGKGMETVTTAQNLVGARLGWIDLTAERRVDLGELRAGEEAEIGATDIAETVTSLQQLMVVLEASQASFARLSGLSLFEMVR